MRAQIAVVPMIDDYVPRSSNEPEWLPPYTIKAEERVFRTTIGLGLRALYEVSQDLSDEVLTLLARLRERQDEK
jgi:hypothetical protein